METTNCTNTITSVNNFVNNQDTKNTLVFDIEIVNAIPSRTLLPGINYCKGWCDFIGMGISVIGFQWNDESPQYVLSSEEFLQVLRYYDDDEYTLVGFNSKGFDDKLLTVNGLEIETRFDLLEEVRIAAGFGSHFSTVPRGYTYKLDAIARANGLAKTGTGELAPVMWQQGRQQEVIDYCLNDVSVTYKLLRLGLSGELIDPNTEKKLTLRAI